MAAIRMGSQIGLELWEWSEIFFNQPQVFKGEKSQQPNVLTWNQDLTSQGPWVSLDIMSLGL